MSKTITVEYTNPIDGSQLTKQVTVDIEKYRVDTEEGSKEKFFLKGSASGAIDMYIDVEKVVANLLDGRPSGNCRRMWILRSLPVARTSNVLLIRMP